MFLLTEAAQIEHLAICEYLYMAFSMKIDASDGLSGPQAEAVRRWERVISGIAAQEMLHLTLVNNLLTAIGGCPCFGRPLFPIMIKYFSPPMAMRLIPFGLEALKHLLFFERPEGVRVADVPEDVAFAYGLLPTQYEPDDIIPGALAVTTIKGLYYGIEEGLRMLVDKYGERGTFIGPPRAQATQEYFGWKELAPVANLQSALAAVEVIVEQGEGGGGIHRAESHFGRIARITAELMKIEHADPGFRPAHPVVPSFVRPLSAEPGAALIENHNTRVVAELFDASYETLMQLLTRFFIHSHETDAMLHALADAAVDLMFGAIRPLGRLMTRMPVGDHQPGMTAGPAFEIYPTSYILPHHTAAWIVMQERLGEMAGYCDRTVALAPELTALADVSASLCHVRDHLAGQLHDDE
ncbi:MAG TPA: ferritin-like domain-containing protein [Anaerolineae bacterium]